MALDKIKEFFTKSEPDPDDNENTFVGEDIAEVKTGNPANTMILLEPRAYSESQQIADYLKNNSSVVVNLKRVTPDVAKRIVDFLSGTIYAIGGDLQKLGGGIFLCTPRGMSVEGKISDDGNNKNKGNNNNVKKEDNDTEDEFDF